MKRALVVYKKSAYQLHVVERRDQRLRRLLRAGHPDAVDWLTAHRVHQRTLDTVVRSLRSLGMRETLVYRERLRSTAGYDLVISVGGDGTVLQASHFMEDTRLLGVNSDPARSEAVFCAATASNVHRVVRDALEGRLPTLWLYRLAVALNGRRVGPLALNDVLIAHEDPATMSRYRLRLGARQEDHKSSGLWVATAAGSSSAMAAAGGKRLPWRAKRFQYRPRELYQGRLTRCRLTGGLLLPPRRLELVWLMREGALFLDGPRLKCPLRFGDQVSVSLSLRHPFRVLGLQR